MATRSGYLVKIVGFVPVDQKNLALHRQALDAIESATKGEASSPDALFKLMEVEEFAVKPVQRRGETA